MPEIHDPIRAPEFVDGTWLQGGPLTMEGLRGRAVLIDFWDYTCVNCLRTLPYLVEWHARYVAAGLTIVGVHAPEFSFAREGDLVRRAAVEFGLAYPLVLDNEYLIWRAYANRCWPAKYLVDARGDVRYYHFGEGGYAESERAIQRVLTEIDSGQSFPPPMAPVREADVPGAVCYRVTPELYLGYGRGRLGNVEGYASDALRAFREPGEYEEGHVYLEGRWFCAKEFVLLADGEGRIIVPYRAKDVNLVMHPVVGGPHAVHLVQDHAPLAAGDAGADAVPDRDGACIVTVDRPRMYRLVANRAYGAHTLTLACASPGVAAYAFTFVSCVTTE